MQPREHEIHSHRCWLCQIFDLIWNIQGIRSIDTFPGFPSGAQSSLQKHNTAACHKVKWHLPDLGPCMEEIRFTAQCRMPRCSSRELCLVYSPFDIRSQSKKARYIHQMAPTRSAEYENGEKPCSPRELNLANDASQFVVETFKTVGVEQTLGAENQACSRSSASMFSAKIVCSGPHASLTNLGACRWIALSAPYLGLNWSFPLLLT